MYSSALSGPLSAATVPTNRAGAERGAAARPSRWPLDLVVLHKDPGQRGFKVQPKRWAVERTFAWITMRRRLACDYERDPAHSETVIRWAMTDVNSADSPEVDLPSTKDPAHYAKPPP
ncbi:transposase [Streptomyces sp. NBC_01537]|uniref:transposase n=1 Tax=Streptomyces sp. NBC_01537 TaxID=2903896 RepID=UPI00386D2067